MTNEMSNPPIVSVIIITWNSEKWIDKCLASVTSHAELPCETLVLDSASADATVTLAKRHEGVRVIQLGRNAGVAGSRNAGLRRARGRYILILDVDAQLTPGALPTLVDFLERTYDAGLAGPRLLYEDGRLQFSCRRFPTLIGKLGRRLPLVGLRRRAFMEELRDWDHSTPRTVDYVIGACQLFRRELLEHIGYLDERIFYGPEDVDYCIRVWQNGQKVYYVPASVVIHFEQRNTRGVLNSRFWKHFLALAYFFGKHHYLFSRARLIRRLPPVRP